jgi:hypothetical protein
LIFKKKKQTNKTNKIVVATSCAIFLSRNVQKDEKTAQGRFSKTTRFHPGIKIEKTNTNKLNCNEKRNERERFQHHQGPDIVLCQFTLLFSKQSITNQTKDIKNPKQRSTGQNVCVPRRMLFERLDLQQLLIFSILHFRAEDELEGFKMVKSGPTLLKQERFKQSSWIQTKRALL